MKRILHCCLVGILCFLSITQNAAAQVIFSAGPGGDVPAGVNSNECRKAIVLELARAQRKYRGVLYGYPKAEDTPLGIVRFTVNGGAWIKVGKKEWKSVAPGFEKTTFDDYQMDGQDEFISTEWPAGRRGLFQTRRVLTSELIPYLGQSARALQCDADTICARALQSLSQTDPAARSITADAIGCLPKKTVTLPSCHLGLNDGNALSESDIRTFCPGAVDALLQREGDMLKLMVEYDAAYRSLLQFSGNFDLFLEEFRWPLTFTIRQAAGLVGQLGRIPCFLSSCEDLLPEFASSSSRGP